MPTAALPRRGGARVRWIAPVALGLLAAGVAGFRVARPAVWRDEAASITMAQRDWPAFLDTIAHVDAVHALYYALLHLWFDLVPYTPLTLRLPSVVATGGTAALLVLLGSRLAGVRAGIAAGAAAAVLPSLVWAGGEGRSFALTAMLATGATLALLSALEPRASRRRAALAWAGYAALLALTAALFLVAVLLGAAHLVAVLVLGRGRRLAGIAAIAAAAAAVSPLLLAALSQSGQVEWIRRFGPPPLLWDGVEQQWFRDPAVMLAWGAVLAVGVLVAALRGRLPMGVLAVALPWAVLPPAALVAVALVHDPVYWPRYATFTAPAVALLLGVAIAALPLPLTGVALLALAVVAVPQVRDDRQPRAKAQSEMQLAADLLADHRRPSDGRSGIVLGQYGDVVGMTTRVEAIAYPEAFRGLRDLRAIEPLTSSPDLFGRNRSAAATVPRMAGLRTVWLLLDDDGTPRTPVPAAAMRAIGLHETGRFKTPGSLLLRWSR